MLRAPEAAMTARSSSLVRVGAASHCLPTADQGHPVSNITGDLNCTNCAKGFECAGGARQPKACLPGSIAPDEGIGECLRHGGCTGRLGRNRLQELHLGPLVWRGCFSAATLSWWHPPECDDPRDDQD